MGIMDLLFKKKKKTASMAEEFRKTDFSKFNAAWLWDDVQAEYCRLHNCEYDDSLCDKLYIYCCNYIAYLFLWMVKKDALHAEFLDGIDADEIKNLKEENMNPAEFVYTNMDGKVWRDDIDVKMLEFLDTYYERLGYGGKPRPVSYDKDYEEIVRANTGMCYCIDFSWDTYHRFEEVLEERYKYHQIDYSFENGWMDVVNRTFYAESFKQEMEVKVEDGVAEEYVQLCINHCNQLPEVIWKQLCSEFNNGWDDWLEGKVLTPELLCEAVEVGDMIIPKPYGEEPAYILGFEADFEEEHGISFVIRGDVVLSVAYRMDYESPWNYEFEKKYTEHLKG